MDLEFEEKSLAMEASSLIVDISVGENFVFEIRGLSFSIFSQPARVKG